MHKIFVSLALVLALVAAPVSQADTRTEVLGNQALLNTSASNGHVLARLGDRIAAETGRILRAKYDFAVQGGAISTITLLDVSTGKAAVLPKGALIRDCVIDVITPATTSASGTMAINAQTAGDLKAALAAASYTGLVACVPVGTAATAIKLTADRTLTTAIATGAITAGKWYVIVHYELSDTL